MKTYIYQGDAPIFTPQHGTVQPGQEVQSEESINHPDFEKQSPKEDAPKAKK